MIIRRPNRNAEVNDERKSARHAARSYRSDRSAIIPRAHRLAHRLFITFTRIPMPYSRNRFTGARTLLQSTPRRTLRSQIPRSRIVAGFRADVAAITRRRRGDVAAKRVSRLPLDDIE